MNDNNNNDKRTAPAPDGLVRCHRVDCEGGVLCIECSSNPVTCNLPPNVPTCHYKKRAAPAPVQFKRNDVTTKQRQLRWCETQLMEILGGNFKRKKIIEQVYLFLNRVDWILEMRDDVSMPPLIINVGDEHHD